MRDFSDSRLEKVCANAKIRSEKMEKQPEAETFGCYGDEAGWKNLANEGIWSSIL